MISMRPSRVEDGPRLAQVHREAWLHAHSDPALGLSEEVLEDICYAGTAEYEDARLSRIRFSREKQDLLLMRTILFCGKVSGFFEAIREPAFPEEIFASKMYLAPEARRHGAMSVAGAITRLWGGPDLRRIVLEVGTSNKDVLEAYRRRGYKEIAGSEQIWHGIPSVRMVRDI